MNNKKSLFLFTSLLYIVLIVGCKGEKASAAKKVTDSVVAPLPTTDSVVVEKEIPLVVDSIGKSYSMDKGVVDLAYSFPVSGPQPLVDSLRVYLSSEMAEVTGGDGEESVVVKPYTNFADGRGMISYYAKNAYKSVSRTLDEIDDTDVAWKPELSKFVMKENETDRYVTYGSSFYMYSGGVHGMAAKYAVTFDKKTGAKLLNVLNPKDIKELQPMIRAGVESYFRRTRVTDEDKDVENLIKSYMSTLFLDTAIIPLPANGVYLSPEGVVFIYGEYEIGSYAIGMPTFTVPYSKIGKFLSPEARRLAGIK